jgi:hypothetical protein
MQVLAQMLMKARDSTCEVLSIDIKDGLGSKFTPKFERIIVR